MSGERERLARRAAGGDAGAARRLVAMLEGVDGPPYEADPRALFMAVRSLHDDMGGSPIAVALERKLEDLMEGESLSAAEVRAALSGLQEDLDEARRRLSDVDAIMRGASEHELLAAAHREFHSRMGDPVVFTTKVWIWPLDGREDYEVDLLRPLGVRVISRFGDFVLGAAGGVVARWAIELVDEIRPDDVAPGCRPEALRIIRGGRRAVFPATIHGPRLFIVADRAAEGPQPEFGWGPRT